MTETTRPSKVAWWTGWVLTVLAVLPMFLATYMNLSGAADAIKGLEMYGYPANVRIPLGLTALACGVLYLIPQTCVLGAILLTGYLGGATATHVRAAEAFYMAVAVGVVAWIALVLREPRLHELLPFRRPPRY